MSTAKELEATEQHRELVRGYPLDVRENEVDGGHVAEVPDWPYLLGAGDGPEEAVAIELVAAAIAWEVEEGREAPAPLSGYKGVLQLRMPAGVYRALAQRAEAEGSTLNATAVMLLAQGLGAEGTIKLPRPKPRRKRVETA